jgi:hypothetical protein
MNRFRIGDADGDPGTSTPYKETPKRLLSQAPARTHTWKCSHAPGPATTRAAMRRTVCSSPMSNRPGVSTSFYASHSPPAGASRA